MNGPSPDAGPQAAADVRCPNCGAPATWDPGARALTCASCGARTEVPAASTAPAHHTLEDASKRWPERPRRAGSLRLECGECGAVVETAPGGLTARCPFCGSPEVAEGQDDGRSFPPDAVLPFTVSREAATAAYRKWLGRGWLRPGGLARQSHLEHLIPIYVPFWAFDFHTHTDWGVDVARPREEPDSSLAGGIGTGTNWSRATGDRDHVWSGVLAQGSTGLAEAMWRGLEPFPLDGLAPYDPRFLAGFAAEHARAQPLAAWQSVREATEHEESAAVADDEIPVGEHRRLSVKVGYQDVSFRQALLPIWVAAYRYRGEVFRFLVNGATGQVQGRAPVSRRRVAAVALVVLLAAAAVLNVARPALVGAAVDIGHAVSHVLGSSEPPPAPRPTAAEEAREAGLEPVAQHPARPIHLRHFPEPAHPHGPPPGHAPP